MPSPYNITNIPAPRVDFIDPRTGLMAREWYRFFFNLFNLTGAGTTDTSLADLQMGPPAINAVLGELGITYDQAQLASMMAQYEQSIRDILNQIETAPTPPQLGTMAPLQQDWLPWVTFDTTPEGVPPTVGTVAWDGGTTLGVQMTTNVLGRVNESAYYYIKASSAITKGEVVMFTGAVGSSGVPTGAPATGVTDGSYIMGVAAESIALNGFGLVQFAGTLKGLDTSSFLDGDILWYDPAVTGGLTKTKPSAPNVKVQMAAVITAGSGGSGSILIRVNAGSVLGGTDSNVQFGTLVDKDLIQYDGALQYWKNVAASSIAIGTATNLAGGAAGSVPYQSGAGATTFLSIGTAGQYARVNAGATAPEWASPAALTKTDDTNVTLTLGGSASTALLNAASITVGWTGTLAATRLNANVVQAVTNDTNVTGSIATQTLTLSWSGQLAVSRGGTGVSTATANYVFAGPTSGAAAAPSFRALVAGDIPALSYVSSVGATAPITSTGGLTPTIGITSAALTKVDDTNVTLTLGGSPTTALLAATSLTLGWTGQLSLARGGTNANLTASAGSVAYSTATALALNTAGNSGDWLKSGGTAAPAWTAPAALTKTDDTNVTLTLGGSASTALLNAASITVGWTGTLAVSRGGTGTGTAFTAGSVVFAGASGVYSQDNSNLFWDDSNNRLGIGTASPSVPLDVVGNAIVTGTIKTIVAATQDAVILSGRAGGTGSYAVTLTPTTLSASRTVTLADGDTTLQAGTMAVTGSPLSQFAATTSAQLAGVISDETGSGSLVFGTSPTIATPTITTSATVPLLIGGTGTTSTLTLRSTSGVGTTGADIIFQTGNNGATEAMRVLNSGVVGIGTSSPTSIGSNIGTLEVSGSVGGGIRFSRTATTATNGYIAALSGSFRVSVVDNLPLTFFTQNTERARIDGSGNLLVTGVGGLGYGTGSGGAVTQATSRTTGVTLNKTNGAITLVSAAGTTTWQTFTVTNSTVAATDTIIVNQKSGTDLYEIHVTAVAAGSFNISFKTTGGTTTEQPVFNFAVIKAVTA